MGEQRAGGRQGSRESGTGAPRAGGAPARETLWAQRLERARRGLPQRLARERYFSAKDGPEVELDVLAAMPLPDAGDGLDAALVLWRVRVGGQPPFELFLPLAADADDELGIDDAVRSDAFVRRLVAALESGEPLAPGVRIERLTARAGDLTPRSLGAEPIERGSVEQSNTSVRLGERAILKVIRRPEAGAHPEVELGRHLRAADFEAAPPFLGSIEFEGRSIVTLHGFVPNEGDAFTWLVACEPQGRARIEPWVRTLGRRVAELHSALALPAGNPEFEPEAVTREELQRWSADTAQLADRVLGALQARHTQDPGWHGVPVAALLAARGLLAGLIGDLPLHGPTFLRMRHHGDLHLGQVLVAGPDAVLVDFEGEPLRPLAARRARHCVLRDVAGVLRSFDYLAAAALRRHGTLEEATVEGEALREWTRHLAQLFLASYLEAAQGSPALPADRRELERLLRFCLIEKALYEIGYELANRPDWVSVPLRGLLALLESAQVRRGHAMPFGAEPVESGGTRFALWAPRHARVGLALDGESGPRPMERDAEGWHRLHVPSARAGTRYRYVLPDGLEVPDPASRYQPEDVHGWSEVITPGAYPWRDGDWRGRPWSEAVVYELHVGAFTPAGTFAAVRERLDHLAELGVTAIELMPVSDFPGQRNWGYDGVLPFAPDSSYGRPEDFKALIEAAHACGIMVILDVVYNHFGPEGAYLHRIAPEFFTEHHHTPWGAAINIDGAHAHWVREFFIHNALYWLEEFHLDGLRLDAVHAILDEGERHLLVELAERVRAALPERAVHLILENEENAAHLLERDASGAPRAYTAQLNDDVHHVLHVAITGEQEGYYGDYAGHNDRLGRALAEGFAFQGEHMDYRGRTRGEPARHLPPVSFVAFIQNHDQVGNRAFGERLSQLVAPERLRAAAAVYLLLPQIPMLFMGEEWGAAQPFPFFCDFGGELATAVRDGRRAEFARFEAFRDPAVRERIPDPMAPATFQSARLDWGAIAREPHAAWLEWYRRILAVRRAALIPRLGSLGAGEWERRGEGAVCVRWGLPEEAAVLVLEANLSGTPRDGFLGSTRETLWLEGTMPRPGTLGTWSVRWAIVADRACDAAPAREPRGRARGTGRGRARGTGRGRARLYGDRQD